jgi:hypothetical protein
VDGLRRVVPTPIRSCASNDDTDDTVGAIEEDADCDGAITCLGDYDYAFAEHCAIITGNLTASSTESLAIAEDLGLLHTLQAVYGNRSIHDNDALCQSGVDVFADAMVAFGWSGTAYITDTDDSC